MSKLHQNTGTNFRLPRVLLGTAAVLALLSAAPVAPAFAQAPDQLRYLDPPKPAADSQKLTEDQRTRVRSAYARVGVHKSKVQH